VEAQWSEEERRWRIETSGGTTCARWLIAAPGLLSEPVIPAIPGLEGFEGEMFHSARWNHDHDITGERVAVIGTGASAIQIVPRIQPRVGRLYVLQRTPPWVLPHADREVGEGLKRLYRRFPPLQRLARYGVYWLREGLGWGFAGFKPVLWLTEFIGRMHIRKQVKDRAMRRKVTPGYRLGCKRVLLSDDWYPALQAPNAELVTERLTEVRGRSLVFADGSEREVDTIVFGTGFSPKNPPIARRLRGADGRTLAETWTDGMRAYLGTTVAGFPNLFMLWGPNTNLAHSSVVFMIECQLHYVMDALKRRADRIEVRREAQDRWNAEVQEALRDSVWNTGGCASWYLDQNGDNPIMWPRQTFTFRRRLREFQPADYALEASAEPERAAVA
jgi:cation diffusion facilitator CzcD-associated flavoprotein CzcO